MRRYHKWAGNENGTPEKLSQCVVSVSSRWRSAQCSRKRGYGPNSLYCRQHAKMIAGGRHFWIPKDEAEAKP